MTYIARNQIIDIAGNLAQIAPGGEVTTVEPVRLAGSSFAGPSLDPNFWTSTLVGTGTATQANDQVVLETGATANSSAAVNSTSIARFVGESLNRFTAILQVGDTGAVNNERKWGMSNGTDGVYFKLGGTTLYVVTLKGGVETAVASSSWNGSTVVPTLTNANIYRFVYADLRIWFYINNVLMHSATFSTSPAYNTINFPVYLSNTNSGGGTADVTLTARAASVQRLGRYETQPKSLHITTAGTYTGKLGMGNLHRISISTPASSASTITMYDNTTATGTPVRVIQGPAQANPVTLEYGVTFNVGLVAVSTGTWDAEIIYE
jgi:hypothetical protein